MSPDVAYQKYWSTWIKLCQHPPGTIIVFELFNIMEKCVKVCPELIQHFNERKL